ncbi:MAG: cupin domain-containing protein [Nanoarchaeota archaeon]|nr:cupin domain-containing protein [Nanoarchaeota archaeon]
MKIKKLEAICNLNTVKDGRGGIFTFLPNDPLVEFSFVFIKKNKIRGNHYHPEFDEYFLITNGEGVLVSKDSKYEKEESLFISKGNCFYIPKGTPHVFYAISDINAVAMLTKKWNDCNPPIVHENLGMGKGDLGDPDYEQIK